MGEYLFRKTKLDIGGAMRCCTWRVAMAFNDDDLVMDGALVECACGTRMILTNGVWIANFEGIENAD